MNNWELYRYAHRGSGTTDTRFKSLVERTITDVSDDSITTVGAYVFYNCKNITTVNFPNATTINNQSFQNCPNLTAVDFPNVTMIYANYAFDSCKKLITANFPKLITIGSQAFQSCSSLTTINIPNVNRIDYCAFAGCTSLSNIELPNVKSIGSQVFKNCTNLTAVVIRTATVATLSDTSTFANTPIASGTGYIYVPDELVDSYKTATNWVTYADQIKPLSEYGGD